VTRDGFALLLPPSEGKAPGGSGPGWDPGSGRFGTRLARQRRTVAKALRAAGGGDAKLLGVKGEALERAQAVNRTLVGGPCLPAAERFTGVVWDHLDVAGLPAAARERALASVLVLSAVAGVVALDDPLPDHRLKFTAGLAPVGRLATSWRPTITAVLAEHLEGALVIDLLPGEHAAAWDPAAVPATHLRVRLIDRAGRPAGHFAKAAKGRLARSLLRSADPERALRRWRDPDFRAEVVRGSG
jgi:cytoplasmic iron level regulating protein YaaA (DUF328/UPF0246 family)